MRNKLLSTLIVVALLCVVPFLVSNFYVSVLTEVLVFSIFALSLNILVGYTGLVSLGHAAFFGVGAYVAGIVAKDFSTNFIITIIAAIIVSSIIAAIIGFFSTKMTGFYFLMVTLAFSQMIYSAVYQWSSVTGGSNGLSGIPKPTIIGDIAVNDTISLYFFILVLFIIVYYLLKILLVSPLGNIFIGIRENEAKMQAVGYNTALYKNVAFIIAGGLGGLAGASYSYFNGFVSPNDIYWTMSGSVLIMVLIGGSGTVVGPILGAAFIVILETVISSYTDFSMLIIGAVFILFVIFAPKGMMGIYSTVRKKIAKE